MVNITIFIEINKNNNEKMKSEIEKYTNNLSNNIITSSSIKNDNVDEEIFDEVISTNLENNEINKNNNISFPYNTFGIIKANEKYYVYFKSEKNNIDLLISFLKNVIKDKPILTELNSENVNIIVSESFDNNFFTFLSKLSNENANLYNAIPLLAVKYYDILYNNNSETSEADKLNVYDIFRILHNLIILLFIFDENFTIDILDKIRDINISNNEESYTKTQLNKITLIFKELLKRYKNYINIKDEMKNNILIQYSINFDDIINNLDIDYDDEKITISFKHEYVSKKTVKDVNNSYFKDSHFLTILDIQKIFKYYNIKIDSNNIEFIKDIVLDDLENSIKEKILLQIFNERIEGNKKLKIDKITQIDIKNLLHVLRTLNSVYKYTDVEDLIYFIRKKVRSEYLKNIFVIADVIFDKLYFVYSSYPTKLFIKSPRKLVKFFEEYGIITDKYVVTKTNIRKESEVFYIFVIDMKKLCEILNINFNELYNHLKNNAPDIREIIKEIIINDDDDE